MRKALRDRAKRRADRAAVDVERLNDKWEVRAVADRIASAPASPPFFVFLLVRPRLSDVLPASADPFSLPNPHTLL